MTKKIPLVTYDYSLLLDSAVRDGGFPDKELPAMFAMLERTRQKLLATRQNGELRFMKVAANKMELSVIAKLAADVRREFKTVIVVGIGGSDLGARTLLSALVSNQADTKVKFLGANTDPEEIAVVLAETDWRSTAINVISKSGDTVEPMATFLLLRAKLIAAVGQKKHARHIIATTDAKEGTLRQIARIEGYRTLAVLAGIGGRYSVLTTVGLFPAAVAGVPIARLLSGASAAVRDFEKSALQHNAALVFAGFQHHAYARHDRRLTVLMPYAAALRDLSFWFCQLWAESLGKRLDRSGRVVHAGLTPIAALGATDQHSQIQLYNEGPNDKLINFLEVEKFRSDFVVPNSYEDIEGVAYLSGGKFSRLIHVEREATALALAASGRPSGTFRIPSISPESIGALLMTFMIATVAMAEMMDIDAFDQPGVEAGKKAMYALLGRAGFNLPPGANKKK